MSNGKLLQFPLRNPDLFSGEINRQVISTGEFAGLLYAAIRACLAIDLVTSSENADLARAELLQMYAYCKLGIFALQ